MLRLMKKSLMTIALTLLPAMLYAYDFISGNIAYNISGDNNSQVHVTFTSNVIQSDPTLNNYYGVTDVNIPETVKYNGKTYTVTGIGTHSFNYAPIQSIRIPKTLNYIGPFAFLGCSQLKTIHISDLAAWCDIDYEYPSGDIYAHSCCPTYNTSDPVVYVNGKILTDIVIPESVTEIKPFSFYNWKSMTSITINKDLKKIGINAFSRNDNLTAAKIPDIKTWCGIEFGSNPLTSAKHLYISNKEVINLVIPETVTVIPDMAFNNCQSFETVTFHRKLKKIGILAFKGCTGLHSITIPYSVEDLYSQTFYSCPNLKEVYMESYTPITLNFAFSSSPTIYVPQQHITDYKKANGWKSHNIQGWAPFPGDLNEDYEVNAGDVSTIYDCIIADNPSSFFDLNADGSINAGDVSALYEIIMRN